jgi:ribonuclease HI
MVYDIYTDGSCEDNSTTGAKAGWAVVVAHQGTRDVVETICGKLKDGAAHSNRAEIEAMHQAVKYCREHQRHSYNIYTDSEVVHNGMTGLGRRRANRDLWDKVEPVCEEIDNVIDVIKTPSHTDDGSVISDMNKLADMLAKKAARSLIIK